MKFRVNNFQYNVPELVRRLGYRPLGLTPEGELNCVRPLAGDYPRFHIYLKEDPAVLSFSLHLDQRKPVYEGTTAHGGDYDGETVAAEVERIQDIIFNQE